jgi:hypothetical protein
MSDTPPSWLASINWRRLNHALTYALLHGGNLPPGFWDHADAERAPDRTEPREMPSRAVPDEIHKRIRAAISDPGAIVRRERDDDGVPESVANWSARAVEAAVIATALGVANEVLGVDASPDALAAVAEQAVRAELDRQAAENVRILALMERLPDEHMRFGVLGEHGAEMLPCADWCYACKVERQAAEIARLNKAVDIAKGWIKDWARDNELVRRELNDQMRRAQAVERDAARLRLAWESARRGRRRLRILANEYRRLNSQWQQLATERGRKLRAAEAEITRLHATYGGLAEQAQQIGGQP